MNVLTKGLLFLWFAAAVAVLASIALALAVA